jgi:DNA-binding MarR family transcriptional regulator
MNQKTEEKSDQAALAELMQAMGLLIRRMRAAAVGHGLSLSESAALARLEREGPATTAELARAESVKPQSMGATVAALEEIGLVERQPDPGDGRRVLLSVTEVGVDLRRKASAAKHAWLAARLAELSDEERQTLFAAGRILGRVVSQ